MSHDLSGMRVAVVSRVYFPEPSAASYRLRALASELVESGAVVDVLTTMLPPGFSSDLPPRGEQVRRAWALRDRGGYVRGYLQYLSFDLPVFFRLLFMKKPDLVIVEPPPTTGWFSRIACSLRDIPYIYYAADIWSDAVGSAGYPRYVAGILRRVEGWAMNGALRVISVSNEFTERIRDLYPSANVVTVGNGVDTELFTPSGEIIVSDVPYLLYAGTASEVHGAQIFLDAFGDVVEQIPDAKLIFIGQGSEFAMIAKRLREFPQGTIELHGRMRPEDVAPWIRGAAATLASVHPHGYVRAFPTKMYASIACGTSVIYAGTGPGADFASQEGVGQSVAYDKDEISTAMTFALRNSDSISNRAARSGWAVRNISLGAVASRIVDAVGVALNRTGHTRL
jgi:glycosyltransferase involved in cell wall biosynthesis